tara:strand:- start:2267 stop:2707 length:441 start_codon:yes stop_codon:yes gene_type:complete
MTIKIDWVLNNEIAIGPAPKNIEDIDKLKTNNIVSVLCLCSEEENPFENNFHEYFKFKRFVLPDHKHNRAPTIKELNSALEALSIIKKFGPVYVHCVAAIERSPLVCMGWLVRNNNLNPTQALEYMKSIHPRTNPLPGQLALLNHL